ncbi:MAG: type IV pilin-like G/H family protein [Cyanobacteria bacterium P01_F01_bin.4]
MADPTPNPDFVSDTSAETTKKSSNNVLWIGLGCLGCGGFGIVLIGVLAAIALPSFLNQANKAIASEARTYVGSMARGQQAYFLETETFSPNIEDLGLGISSQTINYNYAMEVQADGMSVVITATPIDKPVNSYTGAVFAVGETPDTATTYSQVCEGTSAEPPEPPIFDNETNTIDCAPGSSPI